MKTTETNMGKSKPFWSWFKDNAWMQWDMSSINGVSRASTGLPTDHWLRLWQALQALLMPAQWHLFQSCVGFATPLIWWYVLGGAGTYNQWCFLMSSGIQHDTPSLRQPSLGWSGSSLCPSMHFTPEDQTEGRKSGLSSCIHFFFSNQMSSVCRKNKRTNLPIPILSEAPVASQAKIYYLINM